MTFSQVFDAVPSYFAISHFSTWDGKFVKLIIYQSGQGPEPERRQTWVMQRPTAQNPVTLVEEARP